MRLDEDGNAYKVDFVSIHASVKDATFRVRASIVDGKRFNPRICKRCDSILIFDPGVAIDVSIHASVKDATSCEQPFRTASNVSIHASVKDATPLTQTS